MAYNFASALENINSWFSLTDLLLPFLLIFTITFAILQKVNIFGPANKRFNIVIALVLALITVIPHVTGSYPVGYDVVDVINKSLPSIALLIVAIIMFLLLIGLFGGESAWKGPVTGGVIILAVVAILWIFGGALWGWELWGQFTNFFGDEMVTLVIIIIVFGVIIAFITSEGKGDKPNMLYSAMDKLGEFMGKK